MRAGGLCTVSAPLAACSPAAALPPAARFLALHLLHQQTLYFIVQVKSRVRELYQQTCLHFAQQGMKDTELFGLALICDGEYLFAEPDSKLSKYAPKSWKSSHSHGLDANGRPALAFYFRVQFYVDSPLLLQDETTRHHYYLQLRFNVAAGAATDKVTQQLAGLALQADLGDYRSPTETPPSATNSNAATTINTTFRPEDYVPLNMRGPQALRSVETIHRSYRGLTKAEARARFIAEACQSQDPINAHIFRLRASKNEVSPGSLTLAVCARGLLVCPDNNPPSTFLWSSIAKLSFERKKFEIRTNHEKITLYSTSDEKSRLLLALCKATHQFSMAVAPRLNEMRREEEDRQKRRWDCDQRISVISSTSSNTTSGIVSDRVHSEDELEIMITSPPAPSTESLALAHLLDSAPASCRTSAASATAALVTLSLKDEETNSAKMNFNATNSETSSRTIASGKYTADSQCSSSCSTVVVTPVQNKSKIRRPSTSSSLELGFSHTAQNSTVSDATCIELDTRDPVYLAAGAAPSSQTSGVYTLTSSDQYTMSSSTCGQYSTTTEDQVDGPFRDRCNSGSFRGDGSDPTEKQPAPLSAEELSDLIVGRYPSCKSVSNTLDSDSDYVTLPSSYRGYPPKSPERPDSIVDMRFRPPPPPYPATRIHDDAEEAILKEPPPYPENIHLVVPPPLAYPSEEVTARFITTRSPNILTAHASHVGGSSAPSFSKTTFVPPIPPKVPRARPSVAAIDTPSKTNMMVPRTFLPPPPPPAPRQPPPPPPPALATVYTSQLSRSQIEQYQQQMYSDVDFVVFPLKEPAISKQEYLEAKQGSLMAALAHSPPYIYRSAPYLNRYASSQNLSDTYIQLPIYGAASISSSGSLDPPPPPLPPNRPGRFMRTRSDDNILNSLEMAPQPPRFRRLPPPPPPPPPPLRDRKMQLQVQHKNIDSIGIVETDRNCTNVKNDNSSVLLSATSVLSNEKKNGDDVAAAAAAAAAATALDIRTLREKSKKMDLPLISALCNDRSLIKQTKAFVLPKHPNGEGNSGVDALPHHRHHHPVGSSVSKVKYPVSGLSSNRINKPTRKLPPVSHRHPGDKLPEIPRDIPRATPNNYVLQDPRIVKHKTIQSFPSANLR